jgi:uncharacterized protein
MVRLVVPPVRTQGKRIVLFGAGGTLGARIAREAIQRGHTVVAVQRNPGGLDLNGQHLLTVTGDATNPDAVARLAKGADVIVSAIRERNAVGSHVPAKAARALLEGARRARVRRLVIVGAQPPAASDAAVAASAAATTSLVTTSELEEHLEALDIYAHDGADLDWTVIAPPPAMTPGARSGRYLVQQSTSSPASKAPPILSTEDCAVALVDEIEQGRHPGQLVALRGA